MLKIFTYFTVLKATVNFQLDDNVIFSHNKEVCALDVNLRQNLQPVFNKMTLF